MSYDRFWDDPLHDMRQEARRQRREDDPRPEDDDRYDEMREAEREDRAERARRRDA